MGRGTRGSRPEIHPGGASRQQKGSCEFLAAAAASLETTGGLRALAENLWAATELLAKAELLTLPRRPILEGKNYGLIKSRLNPHGGE